MVEDSFAAGRRREDKRWIWRNCGVGRWWDFGEMGLLEGRCGSCGGVIFGGCGGCGGILGGKSFCAGRGGSFV